MKPQNGEGLRGPTHVPAGGTIQVEVGSNASSVELNYGSTTVSIPVAPGKAATIPIPRLRAGTIVGVTVGSGLRQRIMLVEVVATSP